MQGGDRDEVERGPISVLLFDHPVHGPVLIDTGYGRRTAVDRRDYPGGLESRILDIQMIRPAADALADLGYDPEDVRNIVLTHAHMDHVGGLEDFPDARVHMDGAEWKASRMWRPGRGYLPRPYRKREIETVQWTESPYGPFDRHLDFFGDGSLVLLPAPGHTAGSLMALVNLPEGSVLYTGDAAWVDENWERPVPKGWFARAILERDWRLGLDAQWRIHDLKGRGARPRGDRRPRALGPRAPAGLARAARPAGGVDGRRPRQRLALGPTPHVHSVGEESRA